MLARKKIAVIGAGKLGETLIKALLEAKVVHPDQITATTRHPETSQRRAETYGIAAFSDNASAAHRFPGSWACDQQHGPVTANRNVRRKGTAVASP